MEYMIAAFNFAHHISNTMHRRHFLKTTPALLGMAWEIRHLPAGRKKPLLSFSTLGCPQWSFEKIVQCAADNGYQGIEIRGIQDQLDLPKCPEFSTPERIAATRRLVEDRQLRIVNLGASAQMHHADTAKRKTQLDEARRFIDLAEQLKCPFIRVFPDDLPADQEENATLDLIIKGLAELGDHAKGSGVKVLLESHGKVVRSDLLLRIMEGAAHRQVGLVWDVYNMWSVTKESPESAYKALKKYIDHVHIKDAILADGKSRYVLPGKGEVPIKDAVKTLSKGGYKGFYSFEWEKRWHPEIEEPELALPHYPKEMLTYFK